MIEQSTSHEQKELLENAVTTGLFYHPVKSCAGQSLEMADLTPTGIRHDREFMIIENETGKFVSQREHPLSAQVSPRIIEEQILTLSAPSMYSIGAEIVTAHDTRPATIWGDQVEVADQGDLAAQWLSDYLHVDVRLVHMAQNFRRQVDLDYAPSEFDEVNFADGYPFLLVSEESLADLNGRLSRPVPIERFRPNIVIKGSGIPFGEDLLKSFQLGNMTFDAVKPCARCVITTTDQQTGERIKKGHDMFGEPLKTLNQYRTQEYAPGKRGAIFGQNLVHRYDPSLVDSDMMVGSLHIGDQLKVLEIK